MKDVAILSVAPGGMVAVGLGAFIGIPVDALVYGFMGGIVAILAVPPQGQHKARKGAAVYLALGVSVLVSVLAAAALGPLTAEMLTFTGLNVETATRGFSFLWGAGAQAGLLLSAIEALRRRIEKLGGTP